MTVNFRRNVIAAILAPALAVPAAAAYAQGQQQDRAQQQGQAQGQRLGEWDVAILYREGWSAEEMIDTDVRGPNGEQIGEVKDIFVDRNGNISRVVVEVGGFLEMGDQHIGVPWKDVTVGPDMQWVQVPLKEVESGTYSLYGRVPQGEDVATRTREWRVNELIGDYASLQDVPRYGMVSDVIFSTQGKALGVIVDRTAGTWGTAGWYGYPYAGYRPDAYTYGLPYRSADVGDYGRWSYVEFANTSQYASDQSPRVKQQQAQAQRQQQGGSAAAGGGTTEQVPVQRPRGSSQGANK